MKGKNGHSLFSASSMARIIACPGSVRLCSQVPARPESEAAREGTEAHTVFESFIKNGPHKMLVTQDFLRRKHDLQMVLHAYASVQEVWKLAKGRDCTITAEEKVELVHIDKELGGTFDAAIEEDFGILDIIDFKFGKHIAVEVANNFQLMTYGVGKAHKLHYNFDAIRLTVIQPRASHADGPVRSWLTTPEMLKDFNRVLKDAVSAAKSKNAPLKAGSHCFFCDAKKICKAFTPDALKEMRMSFAKPKTPEQIRAQLVLDFGAPVDSNKKKSKRG